MLVEYKKQAKISAVVWLTTILTLAALAPTSGNIWVSGDVIVKSLIIVCVVALAVSFWAYAKAKGYSGQLGIALSILTILGFIMLAVLPDKHSKSVSKLTSEVEVLNMVPPATLGATQPTIIVTPREVIAFRFLMMAWGVGLFTLVLSGTSYLMLEWKQSKVSSTALVIGACIDKVMQTTPDCHVPFPETNGTCSNRVDICNSNYQFDQLVEERTIWDERAMTLSYAALWLLTLPTLLFYSIRFGLTGRLKPLLLLSR
jgi:hypothetical protein